MVNYQNGKIYKIINENYEIIYIGSTAEKHLSQRYTTHQHKAPNHKIILIENYPCNSKQELRKREQQIIEEHCDLLNKHRAYCNEDERKEDKKLSSKKIYENNKDKIQKRAIEWNKINKEKRIEINKKYYENNKEYFKNYKKEYYENNKEEILKKLYEKVKCEFCNCEINKNNLKRHQKSMKCLKFQEIITK